MEYQPSIEKPPIKHPALVLLLGPSGAGKTEIIKNLVEKDSRIVPVPVYTDRPQRVEDVGRKSITPEEFSRLIETGEILSWQQIYGNRYGVSREAVEKAISEGNVPIQDYPEELIKDIRSKIPVQTIYITPPSLGTLRQRINNDERDVDGQRYEKSREELLSLVKKHFKTDNIDGVVINKNLDQAANQVLKLIYKKAGDDIK